MARCCHIVLYFACRYFPFLKFESVLSLLVLFVILLTIMFSLVLSSPVLFRLPPVVLYSQASLLPCPLHISNFSLRLSEPRGVSTAARNDEESRKELGSASDPGVMSASEACHSRQTRSSVAGAASKRTEKSAKKGGRSSTAATPAGAPSTSTLPIANPVFSRSNSNTASTYSNPVGLEAWVSFQVCGFYTGLTGLFLHLIIPLV